jgi:hypothetical protein
MRRFLTLLAMLALPALLRAETACITSPDSAQTYAYGSISSKKLIWDEDKQQLQAIINFTNVPYAQKDQPKTEEFFAFNFPGVTYDPKSKTFFAPGEKGGKISVASLKEGLITDWIEPGPKTHIFVVKKSGRIEVTLAATTEDFPNPWGMRWVERSEGFSFHSLLSGD